MSKHIPLERPWRAGMDYLLLMVERSDLEHAQFARKRLLDMADEFDRISLAFPDLLAAAKAVLEESVLAKHSHCGEGVTADCADAPLYHNLRDALRKAEGGE